MPPDRLILAFDTSAAHCAAALLHGDRVLAERSEEMGKGQAERLVPMLEEMLRDADRQWRDLTAIGVGTGPGNFTGVRIAVATARGLALGLSVPAIGVSALEAQAEGLVGPVISTIDARRDGVYLQTFGPETPPRIADPARPGPLPFAAPVCVGYGSTEVAEAVGGTSAAAPFPLAVSIARIASRRHGAERPAPLYLRPADAAPSRDVAPQILP